nr:XRE family transcriptional regulator [Pectobacterium brasiliense]
MKEKGWTQKEAAEKLGISQSRVSELKNAKIELFTIDAMFDMLDALGFPREDVDAKPTSGINRHH